MTIPTVSDAHRAWGLPEPSSTRPSPADEAHLSALRDILLERQRQDQKFGEQNLDPMLYLTVLTEEVGEIAKAILDIRFGKDTLAHLREEAVQTAAVALAFVECLDRGKWKDAGGEPVTEAPPPTLTIRTATEEMQALLQRIAKSGLEVSFNPDRGGSIYSDHDYTLDEKRVAQGDIAVVLPERSRPVAAKDPVPAKPDLRPGVRVRTVDGPDVGAEGVVVRRYPGTQDAYEIDCRDGFSLVARLSHLEVISDAPTTGASP